MHPLCHDLVGARLGGVEPRVPPARAAERRRLAEHVRRPRRRRSTTCACCRRRSTSRAWSRSATRPAATSRRSPRRATGPSVLVTGVVAQAGVLDLERAWEWRLSNGVVRRLLGGTPEQVPDRYAAASPAARLPLGVPALLTHGGKDDIVPPAMSEEFARAAGCDLVDRAGRGPLRAPRPGEPAVAGGGRVAAVTPRRGAGALDAADPLRDFRDRFVDDDRGASTSTATRSAASRVATRDRLAATVAQWGAAARLRLARLDRRPRARRRPAGRARPRRPRRAR